MATQGIIAGALPQDPAAPIAPVTPVALTDPQTQSTAVNAGANAAPQSTATPAPGVAGYNPTSVAAPTQWNVDPNQTVAGNVKSIIDDNSPIIQQARTNAKEAANSRGMLNSSMAVQAGENAVYQAATPIATADAATQSKAAGYNADQINQANTQNAQYTNASAQFNAKSINDAGLATINNNNTKLIQTNAQAASLMNQATGVINNITANNQMDAAAKTDASRQVYANLQTQLDIISKTSGLDLGSLLIDNPYAAGGSNVPSPAAPTPQPQQLPPGSGGS